jgi:hypothetical protein
VVDDWPLSATIETVGGAGIMAAAGSDWGTQAALKSSPRAINDKMGVIFSI